VNIDHALHLGIFSMCTKITQHVTYAKQLFRAHLTWRRERTR